MPLDIQALVAELRAWCDTPPRYGRRTQAAKAIGVSVQTVTNWFAINPRQRPTGQQTLAILEFLKAQRKKGKP